MHRTLTKAEFDICMDHFSLISNKKCFKNTNFNGNFNFKLQLQVQQNGPVLVNNQVGGHEIHSNSLEPEPEFDIKEEENPAELRPASKSSDNMSEEVKLKMR